MSYTESLGRVKGDKGKVYVPKMKVVNNRKYITWELKEESENEHPADIDITPQVYLPSVNTNGEISFFLTYADTADLSIGAVNIKGEKGDPGAVETVVVDVLPKLEEARAYAIAHNGDGPIYIHDGIATVYDYEKNEFYDLDNLLKFDDYYTKDESGRNFYTKTEIDNMLGNIVSCQEAIIYTLDTGSVNIPHGD